MSQRTRAGADAGADAGTRPRGSRQRVLAPVEPRGEVLFRQRPAQVVALNLVASEGHELFPAGLVLDALGHHREPEVVAEVNDGLDDARAAFFGGQPAHEAPVDL